MLGHAAGVLRRHVTDRFAGQRALMFHRCMMIHWFSTTKLLMIVGSIAAMQNPGATMADWDIAW